MYGPGCREIRIFLYLQQVIFASWFALGMYELLWVNKHSYNVYYISTSWILHLYSLMWNTFFCSSSSTSLFTFASSVLFSSFLLFHFLLTPTRHKCVPILLLLLACSQVLYFSHLTKLWPHFCFVVSSNMFSLSLNTTMFLCLPLSNPYNVVRTLGFFN